MTYSATLTNLMVVVARRLGVGSAYGYAHRLEKKLPEVVPISTLVLPLVVEFHRNIARHWLKFNFEPRTPHDTTNDTTRADDGACVCVRVCVVRCAQTR
jgi:hypothetical protein